MFIYLHVSLLSVVIKVAEFQHGNEVQNEY